MKQNNNVVVANEDFDTKLWVEDFYEKEEKLKLRYEKSQPEEIYIDLFGSLEASSFVMIEELPKGKVKKVPSFHAIEEFTIEYNKVIIYAREFDKLSLKMQFMTHINAFVIDIDEVRSNNIDTALDKMDKAPIKPNYVVNSGNGLHLYYILEEKFDFKNYTTCISFLSGVERVTVRRSGGKSIPTLNTAGKIKDIYSVISSWYSDDRYKVDKPHLAQGFRMFGGKTKNPSINSQVFKVHGQRYDIEDFAKITGVELLSEAEQQKLDKLTTEKVEEPSIVKVEENKIIAHAIIEAPPLKIDLKEYSKALKEFVKNYLHDEPQKKKIKRRVVPKWDSYNYLLSSIKENFREGIRYRCLHILSCHGKLYKIPEQQVINDVKEVAKLMNIACPMRPVTPTDVDCALRGYYDGCRYKNETITKITNIPFGKTQKEIQNENKKAKETERKVLVEIAEQVYSQNAETGYRELEKVVRANGIKRCKSALAKDSDILEVKRKHQKTRLSN